MLPHLEDCHFLVETQAKRGGGPGRSEEGGLFRTIECAQAVKSSELRCQHGGPMDYNF